jgi:hypothetical protein
VAVPPFDLVRRCRGLVYLAIRTDQGKIAPDIAAVAAGVVVLAAIVLSLGVSGLREFVRRINKASVGSVSLELGQAEQAARQAVDTDPEDDKMRTGTPTSVMELRMRLEAKLAWIAKHLLVDNPEHPNHTTFVTIGSLRFDKLLSEEEAQTAATVMALRDEELDRLPDREREAFLSSATKVVNNLRAAAHFGSVRNEFDEGLEEGKEDAWHVLEIPRGRMRPDLLAERGDDRFRVVPRFALSEDSENLDNERLENAGAQVPLVKRRVIVVPDESDDSNITPPTEDPRVVRRRDVRAALDEMSGSGVVD